MRCNPLEALHELQATRPALHGGDHDPVNWQVNDEVLAWLAEHVSAGWLTLETGCGYSTVVVAACGATHTVVSPDRHEHDRIRTWCARHGISTDRLRFVAGRSQIVLPGLDLTDLDLVLIDGDHAFPVPFMDWYFTVEALKVGGMLVIDDLQIRTVSVLCDFLRAETERWSCEAEFETTAVFRKISSPVTDPWSWRHQPWAAPHPSRPAPNIRDLGKRAAKGILGLARSATRR